MKKTFKYLCPIHRLVNALVPDAKIPIDSSGTAFKQMVSGGAFNRKFLCVSCM